MQWIEYITDYRYFAISFEFILSTSIHVHVPTSYELLSVLMNDTFFNTDFQGTLPFKIRKILLINLYNVIYMYYMSSMYDPCCNKKNMFGIQNWLHSPSISVQMKEKYCTSSSRTRVMEKCYFKTVILSGDNNQTWISLSKFLTKANMFFLLQQGSYII
jgi:hypothetical protein